MSFVSDKFNESFILEEGINNKTLKEFLYSLSKGAGLRVIYREDDYEIHHKNHRNTDNSFYNICLFEGSAHNRYHDKLNKDPTLDKDEVLKEFDIAIVDIGGFLYNLFNK